MDVNDNNILIINFITRNKKKEGICNFCFCNIKRLLNQLDYVETRQGSYRICF